MSQSKLFSYFGRKRKEMEEMERENIAESTSSGTTMKQPPTKSMKLNVAYAPDFINDTKEPCQPFLDMYPKRTFGRKQRSFNSDW